MSRTVKDVLPMIAMLGLAACAPAAHRSDAHVGNSPSEPARLPLRVAGDDRPFANHDGALARKQADMQCGPRGVRTSIYDRFDNGTWVYPEGCA